MKDAKGNETVVKTVAKKVELHSTLREVGDPEGVPVHAEM